MDLTAETTSSLLSPTASAVVPASSTVTTPVSIPQSAVDLTDTNAMLTVAKQAIPWLNYYYTFSEETDYGGAWDQKYVQWHESGIYFNLYMNYMKYTGDFSWTDFVSSTMLLAFHESGDLLGGCVGNCNGVWNDDIGWWGLAAMAAAELYPKNTIMSSTTLGTGQTWLYAANFTLYDMMTDWDDKCGGGIYWNRDRMDPSTEKRYLKSAISNEQATWLAIRLYLTDKDPDALRIATTAYDWLLNTIVDRNSYFIFDGIHPDANCAVTNFTFSYHYGVMMASSSMLYTLTQNASYLNDAVSFFTYFKTNMVSPTTGEFTDPYCNGNCKDPTGFLWSVYEGLSILYNTVTDPAVKTDIKTLMINQGSILQAKQGCNAQWNCIRTNMPTANWAPMKQYYFPNGTNPRDQFEWIAYVNSMVAIDGPAKPTTKPTNVVTATVTGSIAVTPTTSSKSSGFSLVASTVLVATAVFALLGMSNLV